MAKTILIVDDFENTRFIVKFTLESRGYKILEASDGDEALKYFDGSEIDLVVTDLNMPKMNGLQLVKEIRNYSDYQYLPILMLTTETDRRKRELARESGVTGWIQKPFEIDRFVNIVGKSLGQSVC
jgi:two-component system chemotaxis response regulator CheY